TDRRARPPRHLLRGLARRRDSASVLRLARPACAAGHWTCRLTQHLQSARAGGDRPRRRGRHRTARAGVEVVASLLRLPEVAADTPEATLLAWPIAENTPYSACHALYSDETAT